MKQLTTNFIKTWNIDVNDINSVDKAIDLVCDFIVTHKRTIVNIMNKQFITDKDKERVNRLFDILNNYNEIKSDLKEIYINL